MILTSRYCLKGKHVGRRLSAQACAVNQVWNYCVEINKKVNTLWRQGNSIKTLDYFLLCSLVRGASKELGISSQTAQGVCRQFIESKNQHKKCPKFRRSGGSKKSLGWIPFTAQNRKITPDSVTYLGKTYRFFGADSRPLPSTAKGGCFAEDSKGRWHVSFYVETQPDSNHGDKEIGVDLGLKDLVTTSDGKKYENPTFYRKSEEKLKVAQRANNKQRIKSLHTKIKNQRRDYLHKLSNKLVRESKLIIVGDVKSKWLAKTRMAKSVLDAGWGAFREMLRYKASRHGAKYLETNEAFTTQTCSCCGLRPEGRPKGIAGLGIREWVCSNCGTSHDRDVNAAKNILNLGRGAPPPDGESLADKANNSKEISTNATTCKYTGANLVF